MSKGCTNVHVYIQLHKWCRSNKGTLTLMGTHVPKALANYAPLYVPSYHRGYGTPSVMWRLPWSPCVNGGLHNIASNLGNPYITSNMGLGAHLKVDSHIVYSGVQNYTDCMPMVELTCTVMFMAWPVIADCGCFVHVRTCTCFIQLEINLHVLLLVEETTVTWQCF